METDFRTNVFGTLAVVKGFLPVLERAPGGATIVNVLSLASLGSFPALGGYSASKAASYSITQALRPELQWKAHRDPRGVPRPDRHRHGQGPPDAEDEPGRRRDAPCSPGVARGDEDIFPDPMAQQMGALWSKSPKEYERAFASM